jgi:hypothetical protein
MGHAVAGGGLLPGAPDLRTPARLPRARASPAHGPRLGPQGGQLRVRRLDHGEQHALQRDGPFGPDGRTATTLEEREIHCLIARSYGKGDSQRGGRRTV